MPQFNVALVRVTIDAGGKVTGARIYQSSNDRYLDDAALQAATRSSYEGAVDNCVGVTREYLFHAAFYQGDAFGVPIGEVPRCVQQDSAPVLFQGGIVRWPADYHSTTLARAVVKVTLRPDGVVRSVSIDKSSTSAELDEAALETARHATFLPGCEHGFHREGTIGYEVDFNPNVLPSPTP